MSFFYINFLNLLIRKTLYLKKKRYPWVFRQQYLGSGLKWLIGYLLFLIISVVNIELLLINVGACQQELALEDTHRSIA